ncbi:DUF4160 domain-containing protein [Parabacteroides sp. PF5-6]|uniref:DUF4160 domain-containing protein n=1 Tax=Parabacteroides sp. PF5-6 TaxID=1742403 RepID=UPI00240716F6|nr:DUF4160 domain-containing protein [Parabacteroides sp. PF5-6]MDF9829438.1 hypothetical protein [Parabacteroides sp. PF5-6]
MPEISRFYGIVIYMYINEHNPPHIHVWYQNYKAVINIENGVIRGTFPRRALTLVYEWLDLHKPELLNNWEKLSRFEAPDRIAPLE